MGARILLLLGERYPIHLRDVALALGARPDVIAREARKLQALSLVTLEPLGDETFITLTGSGITYLGLSPKDAARLRARKLPPSQPRDDHDPAFG